MIAGVRLLLLGVGDLGGMFNDIYIIERSLFQVQHIHAHIYIDKSLHLML